MVDYSMNANLCSNVLNYKSKFDAVSSNLQLILL